MNADGPIIHTAAIPDDREIENRFRQMRKGRSCSESRFEHEYDIEPRKKNYAQQKQVMQCLHLLHLLHYHYAQVPLLREPAIAQTMCLL